jgi:hypothetical protein
MNKIKLIIRFLCLSFLLYSCTSEIDDTLVSGIIPAPASMERQHGQFFLNHSVSIFYNDDDLKATADYLADNGRKLIGWDEILEGGLATGAAVMSWRGEEGGIEAA